MLIELLLIMFGGYGVGAAVSVFGGRWPNATRVMGHTGLLVGALGGVALSVKLLLGGASTRMPCVALPHLFPFANLVIEIDGLSAFFILVVSLVAIAAAIYGPAYLKAHSHSSPAVEVFAINVFVASMVLVLCAGDAMTFLLAWEGMTLASYALVVCDNNKSSTHAGLIYIVMAHGGTALLMVVFLALTVHAGSFDFAAFRTAGAALSSLHSCRIRRR